MSLYTMYEGVNKTTDMNGLLLLICINSLFYRTMK